MDSIEQRLSKLENAVFGAASDRPSWRDTVGMFDDDAFMGEVIEEALSERERERQMASVDADGEDVEAEP